MKKFLKFLLQYSLLLLSNSIDVYVGKGNCQWNTEMAHDQVKKIGKISYTNFFFSLKNVMVPSKNLSQR